MSRDLTMHPDQWMRRGSLAKDGPVVGYKVAGMPAGQSARIVSESPRRDRWRIIRINSDNTHSELAAEHASAEAALAELQNKVLLATPSERHGRDVS